MANKYTFKTNVPLSYCQTVCEGAYYLDVVICNVTAVVVVAAAAVDVIVVAADVIVVTADVIIVEADVIVVAADVIIVAADVTVVAADVIVVAADVIVVAADKEVVAADVQAADVVVIVITDKEVVVVDAMVVVADVVARYKIVLSSCCSSKRESCVDVRSTLGSNILKKVHNNYCVLLHVFLGYLLVQNPACSYNSHLNIIFTCLPSIRTACAYVLRCACIY